MENKKRLFRARNVKPMMLNVDLIKTEMEKRGIKSEYALMREFGFAPRLIQKWKRQPLAQDKIKLLNMLIKLGFITSKILKPLKNEKQ